MVNSAQKCKDHFVIHIKDKMVLTFPDMNGTPKRKSYEYRTNFKYFVPKVLGCRAFGDYEKNAAAVFNFPDYYEYTVSLFFYTASVCSFVLHVVMHSFAALSSCGGSCRHRYVQ